MRGESKKQLGSDLGWIHYRALMRAQRQDARIFYAVEAEKTIGLAVNLKGK